MVDPVLVVSLVTVVVRVLKNYLIKRLKPRLNKKNGQ
jgi:hypothetical protein